MASIEQLKEQIDLHDLAEKLGIARPGGHGNYRSPVHGDKSPSLSIYEKAGRWGWKDHSTGEGGSCIDLVMYVEGCEVGDAVKQLHQLYGLPMDRPDGQPRQKTLADGIAERSLDEPLRCIEYLRDTRKIDQAVIEAAIKARSLGFNDYTSDKRAPGEVGHCGPAVAFIVRSLNPGHVQAVELRYLDPALNGGVKTQTQGEKNGAIWYSNARLLKSAKTVYLVESPINALSVECCRMGGTAAVATRGTNNIEHVDWRFLRGKRVIICMDNDEPMEQLDGYCPGAKAAWALHEKLTVMNIAAHLVDQADWECNDVNDFLVSQGGEQLKYALHKLDPYVIPGVRGDDKQKGRGRVFLPAHDFAQYWRYRAKEDFTTVVTKMERDPDTGDEQPKFADVCGFRIAALSRVTIASATSTMTGEVDNQPHTLFAVSAQIPRHGNNLVRRVFEDEKLHNVDQWQKFGPVFNRSQFLRMVNVLERGADLGAKQAVNFVGLAWRDGRPIVNEGTDCYFSEPDKQCPYHNLTFPTGPARNAGTVLQAYQETFQRNAASMMLLWAIGGHLKAYLGFWPHLVLQADKGMGKSTLVKRLERTIGMTMFSGQSLQTEFRLLTSISHTSHPVGWEEISARRQDVIDKAVSILQECYQYSLTRRGSDMTEYLQSAPVLLAGEDVPVKSLLGKLVRTDLTGKKGPLMDENLPCFPMAEWLKYLSQLSRDQVRKLYDRARAHCLQVSMASGADEGAKRMAGNYAALLTAWRLLCEFAGIDRDQGGFVADVVSQMNDHIADTNADREPWVWIIEIVLSEISAGNFRHPYKFDTVEGDDVISTAECLCIRPSHVMDHIAGTIALREKWNMLPVKSERVLKRQLIRAGVVFSEAVERTINKRREAHLVALSLDKLATFGLHASRPDESSF